MRRLVLLTAAFFAVVATPAAASVSISGTGDVDEGAATSFTVSRTAFGSGTAQVTVTLSGTAACPADAAIPGSGCTKTVGLTSSLLFGDSETIDLSTVGDDVFEDDETVVATITATGDEVATATATKTIRDDDEAPLVTVAPATAAEGAPLRFTLTKTGATALPGSVAFAVQNGPGTEDADITGARSGRVDLPADATTATVEIATAADTVFEDDETVQLVLSDGRGVRVADAGVTGATGTIDDDDAAPAVSVSSPTATEGGTLAFTATLAAAAEKAVPFGWAVAGGTAEAGDLTGPTSGTLTFAPGTTTGGFSVQTTTDAVYEGAAETFGVGGGGIGTITDDDPKPVLSLGASTATATEAGALTLPVTKTGATELPATIGYAVTFAGKTATAADVVAPLTGTVTLAPGQSSGTLTVLPAQDLVDELDETLTIALTTPGPDAAAGTPLSAAATIADDDTATVSVRPLTVEESTGPAQVPVVLSTPSDRPISVAFATEAGTATADQDFAPATGRIDFAPGETTKAASVALVDDAAIEGDETFDVLLSDGPLGDARATVTLTSADQPPAPPAASDPGNGALPPAPTAGQGSRFPSTDKDAPQPRLTGLKLARGKLAVKLSCPATETVCRGQLSVLTVPIKGAKDKRLRQELRLGSRVAVVPGGKTASFTLPLTKSRLKLLRTVRTFRAAAFAVVRDGAGNVGTATATGTLKAR